MVRMRKYLIGVLAGGLLGAVALSGISSADVTTLTSTGKVTPSKQDKKKRGGATVFFQNVDTHDGVTVPPGGPGCAPPAAVTTACKYFPPSTQTVIQFPRDYKFTPGTIPDCNLSSLAGKDAAGARAACPGSVVGQGSSVVHTLTEAGTPPGNPGVLNGTVTAFNGAPSGGNPTLYVHIDIAGVATKPILTGTFTGPRLTVAVPPVTGTVIESFNTTIGKRVSLRNKKTGKKTFYFSARCSKKKWTTTVTNTYQGGKTLSSTFSQKCKQR